MKRKAKLKDGYYFRIPKGTSKDIKKNSLDSMVIVTDGEVKEFYQCYAKKWVSVDGINYSKGAWCLECMGDL